MARTIVRTGFNAAITADERVFTDARKIDAEAVGVAVVFALHLLARDTFPSFVTNGSTVGTISVFGGFFCAFHFVARNTFPIWITDTFGTTAGGDFTHTMYA